MVTTIDDLALKLNRKIDLGIPDLDTWDQYVRGTVPLEFIAPEVREACKDRLKTLQIPFARHIIASIEERLTITGFRSAGQEGPDRELWEMFQTNNLDEQAQLLHAEALTSGRAFALVWADANGRPVITVESPRECAVLFSGPTRTRAAGLKRWVEDERGHAVLFLPDQVIRFTSRSAVVDDGTDTPGSLEGVQWDRVNSMPNPLGVVPLVPFVNRPTITDPYGRSELADVRNLLDALTKLSTDLMVSAESHASPRRWASGIQLEEETDDETGAPTGQIETGSNFSDLPGRLWISEDPASRFGQFNGSDLVGFQTALTMLKRDLGSVSSLPHHYLGLMGDQPASADAIRSAEASLVSLVKRKAHAFAGSWEETMRLAHAVQVGYFAPGMTRLETLFAGYETRTDAQSMDAASKGVSSNILDPDFAAEKYLGLTPTESARNREARRARELETAAANMVNAASNPKAIEQ